LSLTPQIASTTSPEKVLTSIWWRRGYSERESVQKLSFVSDRAARLECPSEFDGKGSDERTSKKFGLAFCL
jgi:hypothetical protein